MLVLWALFGLLGGAFAYRLADRTLEERVGGGLGWLPRCARCGRVQGPLERLAVLAVPLRRACPGCGKPPDRQQLVAELGTAALVLALGWRVGGGRAAVAALGTLVLVTVTLTDLRERLIPNAITYPATALMLILSAVVGGAATGPIPDGPLSALVSSLAGALTGGAVGALMLAIGLFLYRRADVFGLGDVKLAVFIGAASGFPAAMTALVLGIMAGGVLGLAVAVARRSTRSTMPYGPALAIGAYLTWLLA